MATNLDPKPWWKSKTIWVAVLTIIAGAVEASVDAIPQEYNAYFLMVLGAANAAIRVMTTRPIKGKRDV